jgi:hypothetical protein
MRLPDTLRLQADALAAGRITGPVQLWRMGLALRAAADHDRERHGLPADWHRTLVAVTRALLGAGTAPAPDQAREMADLLLSIASYLDAGPPDPSCPFARRAA